MTEAEMQAAREALVKKMCASSGQEFIDMVYKYCRGGALVPDSEMRNRVNIEDNTLNDRPWYRYSPKEGKPMGKTTRVLYIHGGAFVMESGIAQLKYAEFLVHKTGAQVWFPQYPIAPEGNCEEALDMILKLYKMMLEEVPAEEIAFAGDSAGGGISLALALYLKEQGLPLPNNLILFSPAANMGSRSLPRNKEEQAYMEMLEKKDTLISTVCFPTIMKLWAGNLDIEDYRVEPINGDLKGLPPMLVFAGGSECMDLGIRIFVEEANRQGADIQFYERSGRGHVWCVYDPIGFAEEAAMVTGRLLNPPKKMK